MNKYMKSRMSLRLMLVMIGLSLLLIAPLGATVSAAPATALQAEMHDEAGVLIVSVVPDSPADRAGITRGDIVLAVDDESIDSVEALAETVGALAVGDETVITVLHGDDTLELATILGERNGRTYLGVLPYAEDALSANEADADEVTEDEAIENEVAGEDVSDQGADSDEADADTDEAAEEADEDAADESVERHSLRSMMSFGQGGAMIAEVVADGPADEAGLVAGDLIVAVDGQEMSEDVDFAELIGSYAPGDEVTLMVTNIESNESLEVPVTLGAHPEDDERAFLGIAYVLAPALPDMGDLAPNEDADDDEDEPTERNSLRSLMPFGPGGAMIAEVIENGPADEAGLVVGDLIVAVDGEELGPGATLGDLIGAYGPGDEVELTIQSDGSDETVEVTVVLDAHPDDAERAYLGVAYVPVLNRDWDQRNRRFHTQPMPRQRAEPESKDNNGCFHEHDGMHDGMHEEFHGSEGFEHHEDCEEDRESGEHHGSDEHSGMMMPFFHHGMGGHGLEDFDFDQLSDEDLEVLQEMFPFLFPDVELESESEGEGGL